MTTVTFATFDGEVLRPEEPIAIQPNTRVKLTIETEVVADAPAASFLKTARALKVDGPPDWSERLDDYLYGEPGSNG